MTDDEVIKKVKFALCSWALGDVKTALDGGAKMGAFILGSCFIDYLVCYYCGGGSTRAKYIKFVDKVLPSYDGKDLYESMRCKLVHNYTEGGKYVFEDGNSKFHLKVDQNSGKTVINLEDFLADLEKLCSEYFKLIDDPSQPFRQRAIDRYKDVGILGMVEVAVDQFSTTTKPLSGYHRPKPSTNPTVSPVKKSK